MLSLSTDGPSGNLHGGRCQCCQMFVRSHPLARNSPETNPKFYPQPAVQTAAAAAADTEMAEAAEDDDQEEGEATLEQSEAALEQPEAAAEAQQPAAPEVTAPSANVMEMSHLSRSIARVPPFRQCPTQQGCPTSACVLWSSSAISLCE